MLFRSHKQIHSSAASPEFFQKLADDVSKQIKQKEEELRQYQEDHATGTSSVVDQKTAIVAKVNALENSLQKTSVDKNGSKVRIDALSQIVSGRGQDAGTLPAEVENPALTPLKARMSELNLEKIQVEIGRASCRERV